MEGLLVCCFGDIRTNEDENEGGKEREKWNERVTRLLRLSKTPEGREERLL